MRDVILRQNLLRIELQSEFPLFSRGNHFNPDILKMTLKRPTDKILFNLPFSVLVIKSPCISLPLIRLRFFAVREPLHTLIVIL
jgi:hypothetical protein